MYVLSQHGAYCKTATTENLTKMSALAKQAMEVGALGFSSSLLTIHRTESE